MASSQKDMEPQGRESGAPVRTRRRSGTLGLRKTTLESRVHVQTVGLNAKKIISALSQGKTFLLTFPFIGSLRAASGLRQSNLYSKPSAAIAGHSRGGDFCSIRDRASPPFKPFRQTIPQTCFILRRNRPEGRRTKFLQLQLIRFWRTTRRSMSITAVSLSLSGEEQSMSKSMKEYECARESPSFTLQDSIG